MMEFQATQVLDEDNSFSQNSQTPELSQKSTEKIQIGVLEISGTKHPIYEGITKIGRHPGSDVCITHITVSKHHAEIDAKPKRIWVCDKKSSNKTRMNGEQLLADRYYELHDGATLVFGLVKSLFMLLRPDDDSLLVPETPYQPLRIRKISKKALNDSSASESDGSIVLGTQEYDENVFRRPSLPGTSRSPAVSRNPSSIHEAETQQFEETSRKIENKMKRVSFNDMETQRFDPDGLEDNSKARDNLDKSIHDMQTQQFTDDTPGPEKKTIFDAETQKFDHDDKENDKSLEINKTSNDTSVHELETQVFDKEDDLVSGKKSIFDAETQNFDNLNGKDEKKINSTSRSDKSKVIHEVETQKFGEQVDEDGFDADETQAFDFDKTDDEKKIEGKDRNKSKDLDETMEFSPDSVDDIHEVSTQLFGNEASISETTTNKSINETNVSVDLLEKKQETKQQVINIIEDSDSEEEDLLADLNKKDTVVVAAAADGDKNSNKIIIDSDSEEDDLLLPLKTKTPEKIQKEKSKTPEKIVDKFTNFSDSDVTDDEDVINAKKATKQSDESKDNSSKASEKKSERQKTPENFGASCSKNDEKKLKKSSHESDSDLTDEEGFFDALASPQKNLKKSSNNLSSPSSSKTENNEEEEEEKSKKSKKQLADNLSKSRSRVISESDDADTDEEEEIKINEKKLTINNKNDNLLNDKNNEIDDDSETDEEGIYALAPSRQASDLADDNSKALKKPDDLLSSVPEEKNEEEKKVDEEEEEEDPSECATQIIQPPKKQTKFDPKNDELLATQLLEIPEIQQPIPPVNSTNFDDDDIAETQLIEPPSRKTKEKSPKNHENDQMDFDDDMIATQIVDLPEIHRRRRDSPVDKEDNKVIDYDDTEATQVIDTCQRVNQENDENDDDDDLVPTQIMPSKESLMKKQVDLSAKNDYLMEDSSKIGEESINVEENQENIGDNSTKIGDNSTTMESRTNMSVSCDETSTNKSRQSLSKSEDTNTSPVKNDKKVVTSTPFPNATKKKQFNLSLGGEEEEKEEEDNDEASLNSSKNDSKNKEKHLKEKRKLSGHHDDGVSQNLNNLFGSEGIHEQDKLDGIGNLETLMTQQLEGILEPVDDDDNLENLAETSTASFTLQVSADASKTLETSAETSKIKATKETTEVKIVEKRVSQRKLVEKNVEKKVLQEKSVEKIVEKKIVREKSVEKIVEKEVLKEKSPEKIVEKKVLPKKKVKKSNLSILLMDDETTEVASNDKSLDKIKPGPAKRQEKKINAVNLRSSRRRNVKKSDDEESQDGYFSKLGGMKKKISAIESQDDDEDDEEVANLLNNTKSKEESRKNIESNETVPLLASPNNQQNKSLDRQTPDSLKTNKTGKSSSQKSKDTSRLSGEKIVDSRPPSSKSTKSEDDVLAGLPEFDMSNYVVQSGDSRPSSSSSSRDVVTPFEYLAQKSPLPDKSPTPCKSEKSKEKSSSPLPTKITSSAQKKSITPVKSPIEKKSPTKKLSDDIISVDSNDDDDEDELGYEDIKKMADSFLTTKPKRRRSLLLEKSEPKSTPVKVKKEGKIHWKTALKNKQNQADETSKENDVIDITVDESPEKQRRGRPKRKMESLDSDLNPENGSNVSIKSGKKLRTEKPVVPEEPFKSPQSSTIKLDEPEESNKNNKKSTRKGVKKSIKGVDDNNTSDEKLEKTDSDVSDNSEGRTRRGNAKKRPSTVYDLDGPRDVSLNTSESPSKKLKKDDTTIIESPSRAVRSKAATAVQNHVILFTGLSDVSFKYTAVKLGATVTDNPTKATILVTDKVRRTFKFFCAVSRSIPIASVNWIEASKKAGHFVDSDKFILHDPVAEAKFEFKLSKSLEKAGEKKLLDGYTIVITPGVTQPSINEIKSMISVSGGKALIRPPRVWLDNTVIISCESDGQNVKKMTAKAPRKIPVVTVEFILSGILKQELDEQRFRIKFD